MQGRIWNVWVCGTNSTTSQNIMMTLSSIFVSPELSSVRDYVITHSVCSMYVCSMYVVCVCMWYFAKLITVSTYIDVLSWDLDTMILG